MKDVKKVRRLPKFWLGTRKPTSLGYLPNLGIGTPEFTSVAGEDIQPEVNAMLSNYIPNSLQKLTLNAQQPLTALTNRMTIPASAAATAAYNSSILSLANTGMQTAITPAEQTMWAAVSLKATQGGFTAPGKTALNALGKGAAIAGIVQGGASLYGDFAREGNHRTAGDMAKTMATNTYYSPGGHAYTQHGGLNLSAEQAYGNILRKQNLTNLTLDTAGTVASATSLTGNPLITGLATVGSAILTPILGSVFGFGDNEEEIEREAQRLMDSTARSDKLSRTIAFNQDTRDAFAKRGAVGGKSPVYGREGKANCMLSSGELYGNLEEGWIKQVPGKPNNKDTKYGRLYKDDYVIRNSLVPYVLATGDVIGALEIQDMDIRDKDGFMTSSRYDMAKCGKMPKYALGTTGEYGLAVLPHFGEFFLALASENRARKANTKIDQMELVPSDQYAAINQAQSDMLNPTDYLKRFNREFNMANWGIRRNPGLGYGGRAIASSDLFGKKLAAYSDLWLKLQEANRSQRNTAANMRFNLGDKMLSTQYDQFWKRAAMSQQANAAKENWMEQARKNQVMAGINAAADALRMAQYNKSLGIQNKMIDLYGDQADREWFKLRQDPQYNWNPENVVPEIIRKHGYKPQLGWDDMA